MTVDGADAGMLEAVRGVYGTSGFTGKATTGTWKGERVAVVAGGSDATLLVGPGSGSRATWQVVGGWWPSLKREPQLGTGPRHVIVIGTDARVGKPLKGTRADTLQLVGIDTRGGAGVLGLPRDIWAPMPKRGHAKLNAAYAYAGGAGQQQAVAAVTGIPVEGYVAVGFDGFAKIVDESGGLPMLVPKEVRLTGSDVVIPAGPQVLTGAQALAYARERKSLPDGDFGRSRHQGELVIAAAVKARLAGVGSVPGSMTIVSKYVDTNLSATQALTFAAAFYRVDPSRAGRQVATGSFGTSPDGQSIVIPDAKAKRTFAAFRSGRL